MGERGELMHSVPPKAIEKVVGVLLPPASREEVLGDLYERCTSTDQYILDALRVLPMVILSRIRRTTDPQVRFMEALALYLSYTGGAWYQDRAFFYEDHGFLRLAIPSLMVLLGLILEDAYAVPGRRVPLRAVRGLVLGLGVAFLGQIVLSRLYPALALPLWILFYGSTICLPLTSAIRILFPPVTDRPVGASGPADWLKHEGVPSAVGPGAIAVIKSLGFIGVIFFLGVWIGGPSLGKPLAMTSVLLLVLRELNRKV